MDRATFDDLLPLTTAQRGIWVGAQIAPPGATFNIAEAIEIDGALDVSLFRRSLDEVCIEVETTRARIVVTRDGPMQQILPFARARASIIDVLDEPDPERAADDWMERRILAPVDLARDPLWVSALLRLGPTRFIWFHCCHHTVLDGFSGGLIAERVSEIYNAGLERRRPAPHRFLPLRTLFELDDEYLRSDRYERDRNYWLEQLNSPPEARSLSLHPDRGRSGAAGGFRRRSRILSVETRSRLESLARACDATLPQALTAALTIYFHRATGEHDLVVGMPLSARASRTARLVPGMAANAAALRFRFSEQSTFVETLAAARRQMRGALRHQQFRYEELRRLLGFHDSNQQISRLGINIEPFDYKLMFGSATCRNRNLSNGIMEDLTAFVFDRQDGHGLSLELNANPALYEEHELDSHLSHIERLTASLLDHPEWPLGSHSLCGTAEQNRRAHEASSRRRGWWFQDVLACIEERAAIRSDATAIVDDYGTASFRQLAGAVSRLTAALVARGVGPGTVVAVALPRDRRVVVAMLSIAGSGAAWLLLDPTGAPDRNRTILADARTLLVVTADPDWNGEGLFDAFRLEGRTERPDHRASVLPRQTAYVAYTSGTTGRPKGVVVPHRALANLLFSTVDILGATEHTRLLSVTTWTFDIALLELFLPLIAGATVIIASEQDARDPRAVAVLIRRHRATMMQATPTFWQTMVGSDQISALENLVVLSGGEALPPSLAERLLGAARDVFNLYGPTETTVWSTAARLTATDIAALPVGRPIANTIVEILDPHGQPLPDGVVGEVAIGGDGLATGYLDQPGLTASRFRHVSTSTGEHARLYMTGDRGVLHDGVLTVAGRLDDQLKIRGTRIEPAEVEAALLRLPSIAAAAVTARSSGAPGTSSLAAYLVCRADEPRPDAGTLRDALIGRLPAQMIPASFTFLDALPRTPSGKLDRRTLSLRSDVVGRRNAPDGRPRTPLEEQVLAVWRSVLDRQDFGVFDNFFELGGDSLSAMRLAVALSEIGFEVPLGHFFGSPTVADLVPLLEAEDSRHKVFDTVLPLRVTGDRSPIFCIHPVNGISWGLAALAAHLPRHHPVYAIQNLDMVLGPDAPSSFADLIEAELRVIRSIRPHGPYHLVGWSMGGVVAHGVAERLARDGKEVASLVLLDAYPFRSRDFEEFDEAVLADAAGDFLGLGTGDRADRPGTLRALADELASSDAASNIPPELGAGPEVLEKVERATRRNLELLRRHRPGHVDVDVLFVRAAIRRGRGADTLIHDTPEIWRSHVGGRFVVRDIAARHGDLLSPNHASTVASLIVRELTADIRVPV